MAIRIPAIRSRLIARVVKASAGIEAPAALHIPNYLRAFFQLLAEEDLAERDSAWLARAAVAHARFAASRPGNRTLVRVFNPTPESGLSSAHTLVQVAAADMPFLVDSLLMVFSRAGIGVHLIVHPILKVTRDRNGRLRQVPAAQGTNESWQFLEIDRQDEAALAPLAELLMIALADVRAAVTDLPAMLDRARAAAGALPGGGAETREARALIDWMIADRFIFLGYRHYRLRSGRRRDTLLPDVPSGLGVLRAQRNRPKPAATHLTANMGRIARSSTPVLVTKANSISTVHRADYLDYVGVKTFDARGRVSGEHRFLGLWTSTAYQAPPLEIPLLRHKVREVVQNFGLPPGSHDAKSMTRVLNDFPRDELFQGSTAELVHIVRGVVNLYERQQVRLFLRRDAFERFYSCLVYVPRERYNSTVRARIEAVLMAALGGVHADTQVRLSASALARLHVVVRVEGDQRTRIDVPRIEHHLAQVVASWLDGLTTAATAVRGEAAALDLARRYAHVFPAAYTEDVAPADALPDIELLEQLGTPDRKGDEQALRLRLYRRPGEPATRMHFTLVQRDAPLPVSDLLPVVENFGLRLISERPYGLNWPTPDAAWIQDFELESRDGAAINVAAVSSRLAAGFTAVWRGEVENDGFNRLLLATDLTVREISVLRACCRWLLQAGITYSQSYMERVLLTCPGIARDLFRLFSRQTDPSLSPRARAGTQAIEAAIARGLDTVTSLDADRILRAFLHVIRAILRTNYWQQGPGGLPKDRLSFKLDSRSIPELPLPRPRFEVFVYSTSVEAVHLRMAHVARGGIRWSDRPEDFRTEILGLMKAQNVKNTVIVPAGAKGGFVIKRATGPAPQERQQAAIACYQSFMRGLLDITDNIVDGGIAPPVDVVRRDGDDPYLVVAADKGTASFSDIANAISAEYGFWLGDAFASGGSAGYDHKKMGITARGAWESVKRHFRELGTDIQRQEFTVAGIGDMSGDVFGNGMLLSPHIRLVAAFNHQHIFLDPAPDAKRSFAERTRLFALPRSSWEDYDRSRISRGGGVFARSAKSIALSREAQALLGVSQASLTPQDLIKAILAMQVDLLWNGGIGTYIKATSETNAAIGDRSNDAVRINGREVRARVIGEGGNLGVSQLGRIEYAQAGGRLNTDFIDNSAGVNTSDLEVNLKILLNPLRQSGRLRGNERNRLLARMTDDVAALVLRNNYLQSQAVSMEALKAPARLPEHRHLIRQLERAGDLNRALEFLPDDETLTERQRAGTGLTRPELAVLLSYGKIWLSHHLLQSDVPEDPYLAGELTRYFPRAVSTRFAAEIAHHRLRREIIATATTNSLVNRMGPGFVMRVQEETGATPTRIARAWTAAREVFGMRDLWTGIEALDNQVAAQAQYEMMDASAILLRHAACWLLARKQELSVDAAMELLRAGVRELTAEIAACITGGWRERHDGTLRQLADARVPAAIAQRVAALDALDAALDIVELATARRLSVDVVARAWFELGASLGLDWLRDRVEALQTDGSWQTVACTELRNGLQRTHRALVEKALATGRGSGDARVAAWLATGGAPLARWRQMLEDLRTGGGDFATLTVGAEALRKLV